MAQPSINDMDSTNSVLLLHPGTQYSHQLAKQLYRKKILMKFITGIAFGSEIFFIKGIQFFCPFFLRKISNRIIKDIPSNLIANNPIHEVRSQLKIRNTSDAEEAFFQRNLAFQQLIANPILQSASLVIGFDTSSWILIEKCKKNGIPFVLDVSIADSTLKNNTYHILKNSYPTWDQILKIKPKKLLAYERYELENASHIVVASEFSKQSLITNGINENKISINAYGIDLDSFKLKRYTSLSNEVKFLFTGLVDLRKGIPLLLDVFKSLYSANAKLTIAGPLQKNVEAIIRGNYCLKGVTLSNKIPHNEIPELLQQHDVYVFPSFFEGFGLVILEAMASGLPVITTTATAGPEIIENGKEGFVIEPGDENGLKMAMQYFVDNPSKIEEMGMAARRKAEQFTWDAYGDRWEKIIMKTISDI